MSKFVATNFTPDEQKFMDTMIAGLPPVIAREMVKTLTGGIVSPMTLAHADGSGTGPADAYKVGRKICYKREALLEWIVRRFGVSRIANLKTL